MVNETMDTRKKEEQKDTHQLGHVDQCLTAFQSNRNISVFLVCALLAAALFVVDWMLPLGVAAGVPYLVVVLWSLRHEKSRFTVMTAGICSILTIVGFFFSSPGGEMWMVLTNRALALFAIWVTAVLSIQRKALEIKRDQALREREEALDQLKILQGFLPICASCKKIRDDKGDWSQLEIYIRDHSEAEFSHGICPDCARKLYPDFFSESEAAGHRQ